VISLPEHDHPRTSISLNSISCFSDNVSGSVVIVNEKLAYALPPKRSKVFFFIFNWDGDSDSKRIEAVEGIESGGLSKVKQPKGPLTSWGPKSVICKPTSAGV
jgi:hypothetical protein